MGVWSHTVGGVLAYSGGCALIQWGGVLSYKGEAGGVSGIFPPPALPTALTPEILARKPSNYIYIPSDFPF